MPLTTHQEIVLKAMQRMTASQQGAVVRFAVSAAKKPPPQEAKDKAHVKQRAARRDSVKARYVRKSPKSQPNARRIPVKSPGLKTISRKISPPAEAPPTSDYKDRLPPQSVGFELLGKDTQVRNDNEWLFSENRGRRESVPARSDPSGQKWATNRWNRSGR